MTQKLTASERHKGVIQRQLTHKKRQLDTREASLQEIKKQKKEGEKQFKEYRQQHGSFMEKISPNSKEFKRMDSMEEKDFGPRVRAICSDLRKWRALLDEHRIGSSHYYNVTVLYNKAASKATVSAWIKKGIRSGHLRRISELPSSFHEPSTSEVSVLNVRTCIATKASFLLALFDISTSQAKGKKLILPGINMSMQLTADDLTAFQRAVHIVSQN
jgi:hypothetical protein